MLMRGLARPLLAAIFIHGGIQGLRNISGASGMAASVVEKATGRPPEELPVDAETLVRVDSAVKIGGGALFALGRFPRLSALALAASLVPTTWAGHAYWTIDDPAQRGEQQTQFYKNVSLLGGLLMAASARKGGGCPRRRARRDAKRSRSEVHVRG